MHVDPFWQLYITHLPWRAHRQQKCVRGSVGLTLEAGKGWGGNGRFSPEGSGVSEHRCFSSTSSNMWGRSQENFVFSWLTFFLGKNQHFLVLKKKKKKRGDCMRQNYFLPQHLFWSQGECTKLSLCVMSCLDESIFLLWWNKELQAFDQLLKQWVFTTFLLLF